MYSTLSNQNLRAYMQGRVSNARRSESSIVRGTAQPYQTHRPINTDSPSAKVKENQSGREQEKSKEAKVENTMRQDN